MKAAMYYNQKDVRIEDVDIPQVKDGQVKIKVGWTGICGSDLHAYHHGMAVPIEEPHPFSGKKAPFVLGHEFGGTVEEVGSGVQSLSKGDKVAVEPIMYCGECDMCKKGAYNLCKKGQVGFLGLADDGGFAEYCVADEKYFHKIPDNMSLEEAALVEPTAVTYQAVLKSNLQVGETAAVFGAGPIGLLTLLVAQAAGASETFVIDISKERLNKAKELGATHVINPDDGDPAEQISTLTNGVGVDVAYEAAGAQPTFTGAINSVKALGTVTIIAGFSKPVEMDMFSTLVKEVTVNHTLAYANVYPQVIQLIASGKLDVSPVITKKIGIDNLVNDGLELLTEDKSQAKILVSTDL